MPRAPKEIMSDIDAFIPAEGDWIKLDALVSELFESGFATAGMRSLFGVFERFPNDDGAGVFWSIVHGLESLPAYESHLLDSVNKVPSEFGMIMLKRLLNSGRTDASGFQIRPLLERNKHSSNKTKP